MSNDILFGLVIVALLVVIAVQLQEIKKILKNKK